MGVSDKEAALTELRGLLDELRDGIKDLLDNPDVSEEVKAKVREIPFEKDPTADIEPE